MQCPSCNHSFDFDFGSNCPKCNVDIILYKRVVKLSEKLYNQGLKKLQEADFTHGIEILTKCVTINKNSIIARNLLGLALFEVGKIGEAIKHWVISSSFETEDNLAESYLERVNKNSRMLEKYNDAIATYNNALAHIKSKSDDLAIIQLKKSIENNPRFVDALNLLALCYLIQNDKDRALSLVDKVLAIDVKNPQALNYYSVLNAGKNKPLRIASNTSKFLPVQPSTTGPYKNMNMPDKKNSGFHIGGILLFVVGAACAIAIMYFLMYPAIQRNHENELAALERQQTHYEEVHREQIDALAIEKDEMQSVINDRDETIAALLSDAELQGRINLIHQAYRFYQDDQLRDAVDVLTDLDTTSIPFDIRNIMDMVLNNAYPRLAIMYYNDGIAAFNANDFYKALVDLEMAFTFFTPDTSNQWRELLFHLGTLYYRDGRLVEARELLLPLREEFPNHRPLDTGRMLTSIDNQL